MKTMLQTLRKRAGFKSARDFAEYIGMNPATYTDYEQGRRVFSLAKAWEFADALDCTLDELAGRDFEPPKPELSPDEGELLGIYRRALPDRKHDLLAVARTLGPGDTGDVEKRGMTA